MEALSRHVGTRILPPTDPTIRSPGGSPLRLGGLPGGSLRTRRKRRSTVLAPGESRAVHALETVGLLPIVSGARKARLRREHKSHGMAKNNRPRARPGPGIGSQDISGYRISYLTLKASVMILGTSQHMHTCYRLSTLPTSVKECEC